MCLLLMDVSMNDKGGHCYNCNVDDYDWFSLMST